MKKLTEYQCKLVEENMSLVDWVITHRIKVSGRVLLTYEDFYQIGCEALCRAAMAYCPDHGAFPPFASRYIYNAAIDHCRRQNYNNQVFADLTDEEGDPMFPLEEFPSHEDIDEIISQQEIAAALANCKSRYTGSVRRGVEALELKALGYTTREIAERYDVSANCVNAWISKARAQLRQDPAICSVLS